MPGAGEKRWGAKYGSRWIGHRHLVCGLLLVDILGGVFFIGAQGPGYQTFSSALGGGGIVWWRLAMMVDSGDWLTTFVRL